MKKLSDKFNTSGFLMIGCMAICLKKSDIRGFYIFFVLMIICVAGMCISLYKEGS